MAASTTFLLECDHWTNWLGLTEKYLIMTNQTIVVHSLQCQQCQQNRGEICTNHHVVIDTRPIFGSQLLSKSNLMLTSSRIVPKQMALWDLERGAHIRDFIGHAAPVSSMLFLDEVSTFASGSEDGTIMLWSRSVKEPTRIFRGHHTGSIAKMIAHDNLLISGSDDNTVRIWELATGECLRVLEGHSNPVSVLMFSPDYSMLRTVSGRDGEVRIWNWRAGECLAVCPAEARTLSQLSDIDGNLVTCGKDGLVRTWTQEGSLVKTFAAHDTSVRGIVRIGSFAITVGSTDGRLKVWDWEKEGEPEWLFDLLENPAYMVSLATTAYGKLAVASWDDEETWGAKLAPQRIQAWDLDKIEELASQCKAEHLVVDEPDI